MVDPDGSGPLLPVATPTFQVYDVYACQRHADYDEGDELYRDLYITPMIELSPYSKDKGYANRWSISGYKITKWIEPHGENSGDDPRTTDWCTINPDTGTIHLKKDGDYQYLGVNYEHYKSMYYQCEIECQLWDGQLTASATKTYNFYVYPATDCLFPPSLTWGIYEGRLIINKAVDIDDNNANAVRPTLMFGETATVSMQSNYEIEYDSDGHIESYGCLYCHDIKWLCPVVVRHFSGKIENRTWTWVR
jgi:hypothetical protein